MRPVFFLSNTQNTLSRLFNLLFSSPPPFPSSIHSPLKRAFNLYQRLRHLREKEEEEEEGRGVITLKGGGRRRRRRRRRQAAALPFQEGAAAAASAAVRRRGPLEEEEEEEEEEDEDTASLLDCLEEIRPSNSEENIL